MTFSKTMRRKITVALISIAALLLLAWIITGGVCVNNAASYYPEGVAKGEKVTFIFKVKTREDWFGVPCLFTYYYDRLPYDLMIVATSGDLGLKSIHLRTVDIKYDDMGNQFVTAASDNTVAAFMPVMYADRSTDAKTGNVTFFDTRASHASISLPRLLTRRRSVTLKLHCFLFYNDGTSKELVLEKELPLWRNRPEIMFYRTASGLGSV